MMDELFKIFFSCQLESDINMKLLENDYCFPSDVMHKYVNDLISIDIDEYYRWLDDHFSTALFSIDDAVQYSDFNDATNSIVYVLIAAGDQGYSYITIGKMIQNDGVERTEWAYRKYGENHAKTAAYLGYLFSISRYSYVSSIGYALKGFNEVEQSKLFARLFIRTTLFRTIYYLSKSGNVDLRELLDMLTDQTYLRRRSSIKKLFKHLVQAEPKCVETYNKIVFS